MRIPRQAKWALVLLFLLAMAAKLANRSLDRIDAPERAAGAAPVVALADDAAGLLTADHVARIREYHTAILDAYDIDYRVATVPGTPDLNLAAARRFEALRVGEFSTAGRGLLLLIAPDADRLRIEVGRGLEPVFTDAFVAYVEDRQMVPFFRAGRVADGILATTELIADRAGDGIRSAAFADPAGGTVEPSTGAGALTAARIGEGYQAPRTGTGAAVAAGPAPQDVVAAYLEAMAAGNADPDLAIFTPGSQAFLRGRVVTRAQMRQIAETYRDCGAPRVFQAAGRAVVRYPPEQRECAPFFLLAAKDGWQLDLSPMAGAIRFNHRNQWRFADGPPADFAFAFEDWQFDSKGFPRRPPDP